MVLGSPRRQPDPQEGSGFMSVMNTPGMRQAMLSAGTALMQPGGFRNAGQAMGLAGSALLQGQAFQRQRDEEEAQREAMMQALVSRGIPAQQARQLVQAGPQAAPLIESSIEPQGPIEVSPGASLYDPTRGQEIYTAPEKAPSPTSLQRDLIAAGYKPGTREFRNALLKARTKPLAQTTIAAGETEYAKTRGKQFAERAGEIQQASNKAANRLGALNTLGSALANESVYTGTGGPAVASLKRTAKTLFGLEDVEGVGSAELAQTLGNQMALEMRDMMPGPMSDADRRFLQSMPPNLSNSREGNMLILDFYQRSAQRAMEMADLAQQYEQEHGQLDPGFDRVLAEYNQQNPLFNEEDFQAVSEAASAAPQPSPLAGVPQSAIEYLRENPETAEQFDQKYGAGQAHLVLQGATGQR